MRILKRLFERVFGRESGIALRTNKWGADIPTIPAGRVFDERVPVNMSRRIDALLAEGHADN